MAQSAPIMYLTFLHLKRLGRYLLELGPFRLLFLSVLALGAMRLLQLQIAAGQHWLAFVVIPVLHTIQFARKDQALLQLAARNAYVEYLVLYALISAPSLLVFIWHGEFFYAGILIGFCFILPAFKLSAERKVQDSFFDFGKLIPDYLMEWKCGFRQYGLAVTVMWIAAISLGFYPGTIPILLLFITMNTAVFYLHGEGRELLLVHRLGAGALVRKKLRQHILSFLVLISPLIIEFLIFNSEYWFVLLYAVIGSLIISVNAILFKYAQYSPGLSLENNTSLQAISLGCFLIPFLMPVPIILSFINYEKAKKNLNNYL